MYDIDMSYKVLLSVSLLLISIAGSVIFTEASLPAGLFLGAIGFVVLIWSILEYKRRDAIKREK